MKKLKVPFLGLMSYEAYRQCFCSMRKSPPQTFLLEFAREKGILFDRWCLASKATDFNSLHELILLEEFKNCVPEWTMVYLNEQKGNTLQEAAVLTEEFALTHKSIFVGNVKHPPMSISCKILTHNPSGLKPNVRQAVCLLSPNWSCHR